MVQVLVDAGGRPHAGSGLEASPLCAAALGCDVGCLRIMMDGFAGV